ncbi:helix-turn-helix transcriptional regulator [Janthinobacterium sp. EB271-G4-7A]|uniref:helix-turn-helix transcriptional regulator n=1 Tax=Janthinobacterium sp. EB271-G4-7A TaxID=2775056 RepID=UPI001E4BDBD5|nr:LuxR family transcriptional regulator [Janthinobacterium sp. EB271-G4-7A]MCC7697939.1 LuxR family transcriptional regulator [Janthinobacterium sp. EB271-G4-7A]
MLLLDDLFSLVRCQTEADWTRLLFSIGAQCGYEHVYYGVAPEKTVAFHWPAPETSFVVSNYPPSWRALYVSERLHESDPSISHCLANTMPLLWRPESFTSPAQRAFYEQACQHGMRSGFCFPVHGASGETGMLSFIRNAPPMDAERDSFATIAQLALIRDYVIESSARFIKHDAPPVPGANPLTTREMECLQWIMAGKSSWEISRILLRSEGTINFHVSNAKKKFNVQTRQQAVLKAIKAGFLIPS